MTSGPSATASSPVASQPLLKQVRRPAAAGGFATEEAVSTFQINPATCQVISGAFSTSSRRRRPPPRDFRRPIVVDRPGLVGLHDDLYDAAECFWAAAGVRYSARQRAGTGSRRVVVIREFAKSFRLVNWSFRLLLCC